MIGDAIEQHIEHKHLGTRIAFWFVVASIAYLMIRIIGS